MTLEAFNLWLALGGAITVPTAVGVTAKALVNRGDRKLSVALAKPPGVRADLGLDEEAMRNEERVPV